MLIVKYQERWVADYNLLKNIFEENISINDIEIEHVGSTSVKGLAAKPIIDIDIVYKKLESFTVIKRRLEELDYYHNGDQGIVGREVFKRNKKQGNHIVLDSIDHHLYVCHVASDELRRHLAFRNYLRENQLAREEYEVMKYTIAELAGQNKEEYASLKAVMARDFVESIIGKL